MQPLKNDHALILDFKATDSSVSAQATQIAWDVITPAIGVSESFNVINANYHVGGHSMLLRPFRKIKPEALAICGIDEYAIQSEKAAPFNIVIPRFMGSNDCEYIICHSATRTIQMLKNAGVAREDINRFKFICIVSLARQAFKFSDYSAPTLYAAVTNVASSELCNYYTGKYDPKILRVIYKHLKLVLNLPDFECAYQKSINPDFGAAYVYSDVEPMALDEA